MATNAPLRAAPDGCGASATIWGGGRAVLPQQLRHEAVGWDAEVESTADRPRTVRSRHDHAGFLDRLQEPPTGVAGLSSHSPWAQGGARRSVGVQGGGSVVAGAVLMVAAFRLPLCRATSSV